MRKSFEIFLQINFKTQLKGIVYQKSTFPIIVLPGVKRLNTSISIVDKHYQESILQGNTGPRLFQFQKTFKGKIVPILQKFHSINIRKISQIPFMRKHNLIVKTDKNIKDCYRSTTFKNVKAKIPTTVLVNRFQHQNEKKMCPE